MRLVVDLPVDLGGGFALTDFLVGAGVLETTLRWRLERALRCESSSSSDAKPELSISSSEPGTSKGSCPPRLRLLGSKACSWAVERALGGGSTFLGLALFVIYGRLGE